MWRSIISGAAGGVVAAIAVLWFGGSSFTLTKGGMTYAELAATLLGASAVLLAIIGVFVAALALWGFTAFRAMTKNSAKALIDHEIREGEIRSHIETIVTEFLTAEFKGGNLRHLLEQRVDALLVSSSADRAKESATTEDDVPVEDL